MFGPKPGPSILVTEMPSENEDPKPGLPIPGLVSSPCRVIPSLPIMIPSVVSACISAVAPVVPSFPTVQVFVPASHVPIQWQSPPVASSVIMYGASF